VQGEIGEAAGGRRVDVCHRVSGRGPGDTGGEAESARETLQVAWTGQDRLLVLWHQ
jgi:hypothetical protein